ncbi:hemicentin-2 isoform X1 [Paramuricea clavata]|uniref:Hemicentin-2 isoform X1 n=1 Tax=Paramuricea clavata TaxID=317549 RepID=A0A7D9HR47_PARCT|nr:hemicentin-2 isoform X1 [Paramuricea clavata]
MTSLIQCSCKSSTTPYFSVHYAELGKRFVLDVKVYYVLYTWLKDDKPLAIETCSYGSQSTNPRIYSCSGDPDLIFRKTKLEDSGKYILELSCPGRKIYSFEMIVEAKPFVFIDCNDMTVNEGDSITCICKATNEMPFATVSWQWNKLEEGNLGRKDLSDILILRNLSRNQSGTYTCLAKSRNLVNKSYASFHLKVMPKTSTNSTVEIQYFKVFQEFGVGYSELSLFCKAEGFPKPNYTISHNGTAVKFGNTYTVDTGKISSLGQYECLAKNGASSDKRLLFLNESLFVKSCLDKEIRKAETEWEVVFIVGACSFLAGIIVLYVSMCCCKKFKKDGVGYENAAYVDVSARNAHGRLGPASDNVEMRLRHTSDSPGNEEVPYDLPVVENTRDHDYYNDNGYQELSEDREKDEERYQSLNLIDS